MEFFFQYLLLNRPHFSLDELRHPNHDILPKQLQYFAACHIHLPDVFESGGSLTDILKSEGHKDYFVSNVMAFVQSLHDVYHLWKIQVLRNQDFIASQNIIEEAILNFKQTLVLRDLKSFLRARDQYYGSFCTTPLVPEIEREPDSDDEEEDDAQEEVDNVEMQPPQSVDAEDHSFHSSSIDWRKVICITGKPGTGKTKCLHSCISFLVAKGRKCLVSTPTGYLASTYRSIFDSDIDCETIHAAFSVPIDNTPPKVNWSLSSYDVIIIDEVSMVPLLFSLVIFEHILSTLQQLSTRPVFVVSGDSYQQQPICNDQGHIAQTASLFTSPDFPTISLRHELVDQFRCSDPEYYEILNHIRHWKPTNSILSTLHSGGRLLSNDDNVSDELIYNTFCNFPLSTFVTVTKAACNRVNNIVCTHVFSASDMLGTIQLDNSEEPTEVYKNMRVIITQNRDKPSGVVNGQPAMLKYRHGSTYILMLPNGRHVSIYPVTCYPVQRNDNSETGTAMRTCYPFVPGYSLTICKCQGQTLQSAIVWIDCASLGEGSVYVALSRVKTLQDIRFLTALKGSHFKPVQL